MKTEWTDLLRNTTAEKPPCTPWANTPILDIIRVRPHEVWRSAQHKYIDQVSRSSGCLRVRLTAKCAFVRNFLRSRKDANLIESANIG